MRTCEWMLRNPVVLERALQIPTTFMSADKADRYTPSFRYKLLFLVCHFNCSNLWRQEKSDSGK